MSHWLKDYPLSKKQLKLLRSQGEESRIENFRETMRAKREKRLENVFRKAERELLPLSRKELLMAGLFLYWGEGTKVMNKGLIVTNTDPSVIKFTLFWMTKILNIPKHKIKMSLHLYKDMNIKKEHQFWSKELNIPLRQFRKPYIKKTSTTSVDHSGFNHGTCAIVGGDVRLKEEVMMGIKAIANKYNQKITISGAWLSG